MGGRWLSPEDLAHDSNYGMWNVVEFAQWDARVRQHSPMRWRTSHPRGWHSGNLLYACESNGDRRGQCLYGCL